MLLENFNARSCRIPSEIQPHIRKPSVAFTAARMRFFSLFACYLLHRVRIFLFVVPVKPRRKFAPEVIRKTAGLRHTAETAFNCKPPVDPKNRFATIVRAYQNKPHFLIEALSPKQIPAQILFFRLFAIKIFLHRPKFVFLAFEQICQQPFFLT